MPEARRALFIDEVFERVVCNVVAKRDLWALMVTCAAFNERSKRELWAVLDSLDPLLDLLSSRKSGLPILTDPSEDDWDRWRKYDHLVIDFRGHRVKYNKRAHLLLRNAPQATLLPNLQKVSLSAPVDQLLPLTKFLLRPTVRELSYIPETAGKADSLSYTLQQLFDHLLATTTPSVVHLDIFHIQLSLSPPRFLVGKHAAQRSIVDYLKHQKQLQYLRLGNIFNPMDLFDEVAKLPLLHTIDMTIAFPPEVQRQIHGWEFSTPKGSFPSLESVSVTLDDIDLWVLQTMLGTSQHRLQTLTLAINLWEIPVEDDLLPTLFSGLISLRRLDLSFNSLPRSTSKSKRSQLTCRDLDCITTLRSLQQLSIVVEASNSDLDITPSYLSRLASSFPSLESFSLATKGRYVIAFKPQHLSVFVGSCPGLAYLCIPFKWSPEELDLLAHNPRLGLSSAGEGGRCLVLKGPGTHNLRLELLEMVSLTS